MLKVSEVSRRLNVSQGCVYELIARGRLPCHRIGLGRGAIRVLEEDLNRFLAATRREKGEEAPRLPRPPKTSISFKHLKPTWLPAASPPSGGRTRRPGERNARSS